ncbi:hypothetical protein, partial [Sphingomonas sp.]|uniref:hypothetical protein n=1 Tax=Sphingomonas sp. TaxID=28214 RepID=UPI002C6C2F3A
MKAAQHRDALRDRMVGGRRYALLLPAALALGPASGQPSTTAKRHVDGAAQGDVRAIVPLSPEHLGMSTSRLVRHCDLPALMLSPTGRYLLSWQPTWRQTTAARNSRTVTISDLDCEQNTPSQACHVTLQALDGLRPVAWSRDERTLFLVEQDTALAAIALGDDLRETRVRDRAPLDRALARTLASVDVTASDHAAQEAPRLAREMARIRIAMRPGETVLGLHVRSGRAPSALIEAGTDTSPALATHLIVGTTRHPLAQRGPELMQARVTFEGKGARAVSATGLRVDVGAASPMPTPKPLEAPLVSASDGRWHGAVSPWSATLPSNAPRPSEGAQSYDWTDSGDMAQRTRRQGVTRLSGRRKGRSWATACPATDMGIPGFQDRRLQLGTPARPLDAIRASVAGQDNR